MKVHWKLSLKGCRNLEPFNYHNSNKFYEHGIIFYLDTCYFEMNDKVELKLKKERTSHKTSQSYFQIIH